MRTGAVVIAPGGTVTHTARPSAQGAASMPAAFAVAAAERSVIKPSPALSQRTPSSSQRGAAGIERHGHGQRLPADGVDDRDAVTRVRLAGRGGRAVGQRLIASTGSVPDTDRLTR